METNETVEQVTVEQIYEDVKGRVAFARSLGRISLTRSSAVADVLEYINEHYLAAHKREIDDFQRRYDENVRKFNEANLERVKLRDEVAAKDAEIEKLKFEIMTLKSEQRAAGEVIVEQTNRVEAKDAEIVSLRAIVKEQANKLAAILGCDGVYRNGSDCYEKCPEASRQMCGRGKTCRLVAKARKILVELTGGGKR